ncbi:hypothetical protein [Longimicrobium sp.]|jgi:hypothetical protein|uniref:hypothetical protein n=1 Tax=Longimicrobium sp. TaxID=2029185 RepID=UPI002ED9E4C9
MAVNSSSPLNAVAALLVLWGAVITLPLGVVGSLSDTGPMRMVFVAMAAGGAGMLYGGVKMWKQWRRAVLVEREHQRDMRDAVGAPPMEHGSPIPSGPGVALQSGELVLARWTYTADEWREYTQAEWKRRRLEAIVVGTLLLLVGYCSGRGGGDEGNAMMAAAGLVGVAVAGGLLGRAYLARKANESAPGEAVITGSAILLNGKYHVLSNDTYSFQGVRYDTEAKPPLLEFSISWSTRKGHSGEKIRVPVPAGRDAEAREVVAALGGRVDASSPPATA